MITCAVDPGMVMVHPGLGPVWVALVLAAMALVGAWAVAARTPPSTPRAPRRAAIGRAPLAAARIAVAVLFLAVVAAGLWGTPIPERNLSTVLTWTVWWTLLIATVPVLGTAWCAVCPWQVLGGLAARVRLGLPLPAPLRTAWPAVAMLCALTWAELGLGLTADPRGTAMLSLGMVVLVALTLIAFEGAAFCRHFCPVGRTLAVYGQVPRLGPGARAGLDQAWFMLALFGLTAFHAATMVPQFEPLMRRLAATLGSVNLGFTLAMGAFVAAAAGVYAAAILATRAATGLGFAQLFRGLAFAVVPLALALHLAHNLGHFVTNIANLGGVVLNPLGLGAEPLSALDRHLRMVDPLVPQAVQSAAAAILVALGFALAAAVLRRSVEARLARLPMMAFLAAASGAGLWLLAQDMVMPA